MTYSLTWLPDVLRGAGLKVQETDGWQSRGHGDMSTVHGVLCHETDGAATGNMPTLPVLINGRSDLAGPLAQLGLGRDGTFYIVAAGKCWHAGEGGPYMDVAHNDGNAHLIGIEAENTSDQAWPAVQLDAYQRGAAAILKHIGAGSGMVLGHKEWAPGRKDDPKLIDMGKFRATVAQIMGSSAPAPSIPGPGLMNAITATVFGGAADRNTSAYDEHVITDTELSVALPYRFTGPRPKVVVRCGSKTVTCDISDVGPWNTNDPYWLSNSRPQSESGTDTRGRRTNHSGIDLSPAAARALGVDGKGTVDWWFLTAAVPPTVPVTPLPPLPPKPIPPTPPMPPRNPPVTTPVLMPAMQPELLNFAKAAFPILDGFFPTWEPAIVAFVTTSQGPVAGQVIDFGLKAARSALQHQLGVGAPAAGGSAPASPLPSLPFIQAPPLAALESVFQWAKSALDQHQQTVAQ